MVTREAAVIAHWEMPAALLNTKAQKKMLIRWTHTLKAFGVSRLILIDVDGLKPFLNDSEMEFSCVDTLEQALALCPGLARVYVEVGGWPMSDFYHPNEAVYIFGSDFSSLPEATLGIQTDNPLHADVTCAVVLHDRSSKWL